MALVQTQLHERCWVQVVWLRLPVVVLVAWGPSPCQQLSAGERSSCLNTTHHSLALSRVDCQSLPV